MDDAAIELLKSRALDAVASAEGYRKKAEQDPGSWAFYHSLSQTYERSAREMQLFLDTVERARELERQKTDAPDIS